MQKTGSLIVIPESVSKRTAMVEQRAVVLEVGPEAWKEESQPRAKPGDKVLVSALAGYMYVGPADGQQYRLVNDNDIFAVITEEKAQ